MKTMIFIISVLIFIACGEDSKLINDVVAKQEKPLTRETKSALDEAMKQEFQMVSRMKEGMARSNVAFPTDMFLTEEKYNDMTFTQFPLYVFDMEKFAQNPCEEQVMECIRPSEDQLLFAGRRAGQLVMSVSIEKVDGHWKRGHLGIMREADFARNYAELPSLLSRVDNNQFFFLIFSNHPILAYKIDGVQYFNFTCGENDITTARFAEMALEQYKLHQENQKWAEEQKASSGR